MSTARTLVDILITFGFELPTVGEKSEGNNAENMFAETVSVEMDRESRETAAIVREKLENAWVSSIIKTVVLRWKLMNYWISLKYHSDKLIALWLSKATSTIGRENSTDICSKTPTPFEILDNFFRTHAAAESFPEQLKNNSNENKFHDNFNEFDYL